MLHLIRPPYKTDSICPPINLLALAAYAEPNHKVKITDLVVPYIQNEMSLDAAGLHQAALKILQDPSPVLGFTAMCSSYAAALRIAEECKRIDPTRFILFGGPHASFVAEETLSNFDFVDAIIIGEGEATLLELLDCIRDERPFHGVQSLAFRDGERIVQTERRKVFDTLDLLPSPSYHLIEDVSPYFSGEAERFMEIEAGRGCPFNCKFCSTSLFFSRRYRLKSPQRIIEEMKWLREHWQISSFGFIHDNLTVRKDLVRELCDEIKATDESFTWFCSSRTDTIDREMMEFMKEAGCRGIFFGIETGSQSMQKTVGKRLKLGQAAETFQHLAEVGIDATASFIIGFPEETLDDLEDTLTMALEVRLLQVRDVQLHPITALPGTEVLDAQEDRIVFHKHLLTFHDITSVIDITDVEMDWIVKHKRIFSNFYAVPPLHYPLELVYQIRGCYFYLVHYRPYTLYTLHKQGGLNHVEIVERLVEQLPGDYNDWTPEQLLQALDVLVAELTGELGDLVSDVLTYEKTRLSVAEFTEGANGWIRFKGELPTAYADDLSDVTLKPSQALALQYDVPSLLQQIRQGALIELPQREMHAAIIFEWETRNLRTLEVDPLTAEIIDRVQTGEALSVCLKDLSLQNPYTETDQEREAWIDYVLDHLNTVGLLTGQVCQK